MREKVVAYPNLSAEISRAGLNAAMLADYMGITRQAVNKKLSGKTVISIKDMQKIQDFLRVKGGGTFTLDYLFTNGG